MRAQIHRREEIALTKRVASSEGGGPSVQTHLVRGVINYPGSFTTFNLALQQEVQRRTEVMLNLECGTSYKLKALTNGAHTVILTD